MNHVECLSECVYVCMWEYVSEIYIYSQKVGATAYTCSTDNPSSSSLTRKHISLPKTSLREQATTKKPCTACPYELDDDVTVMEHT